MIHDFEFEIPGQPPSVNRMYGNANRGSYVGRRKLDEINVYQADAILLCQRAKPALWQPRETHNPKLGMGMIVIELFYYLDRDIDCDNTQKAILDAIKMGLGTVPTRGRTGRMFLKPIYDDNRYLPRAMWKQTGVKHPKVGVKIIG